MRVCLPDDMEDGEVPSVTRVAQRARKLKGRWNIGTKGSKLVRKGSTARTGRVAGQMQVRVECSELLGGMHQQP